VFGFLATPAGVRAVGDAIDAERVDVAHCHVSIVSPAAVGGALHAERRRVPTVVTFHSVVPRTDLLARAASVALGTTRWRVKYSAVSDRVARDIRPMAGAQSVTLLPNGIDVDFWRVEPAPRRDGVVRLLSVMRLNPKKRPLALVSMMRRLAAMLPSDLKVELRIVGDGPQRARLERAIGRAGLGGQIELVGRQTRPAIRTLLSESDLFVLPTVRESFGLAALEARCAGVPVVAMRASGVAELVEHGREGLLADSDAHFVAQVASLVTNAEFRGVIARHNRETSPACDWPRVIDAHLALYREAIALRATV